MFEDDTDRAKDRLREVNAIPYEEYRAMLDDRLLCLCGHPRGEHDHGVDCACCDCPEFMDQNDLVPQPKEVRDGHS